MEEKNKPVDLEWPLSPLKGLSELKYLKCKGLWRLVQCVLIVLMCHPEDNVIE